MLKRRRLLLLFLVVATVIFCLYIGSLPLWFRHLVKQVTIQQLVVRETYPGSFVTGVDAWLDTYNMDTLAQISITFVTADDITIVQAWYSQHPGDGELACTPDFPNPCGLELINPAKGKNLYQITYILNDGQIDCLALLDCSDHVETFP